MQHALLNIVKHRLQACSRPAARTVTIHQIHFLNILPFLAHSDAFVPPPHRGHVLLGDAPAVRCWEYWHTDRGVKELLQIFAILYSHTHRP